MNKEIKTCIWFHKSIWHIYKALSHCAVSKKGGSGSSGYHSYSYLSPLHWKDLGKSQSHFPLKKLPSLISPATLLPQRDKLSSDIKHVKGMELARSKMLNIVHCNSRRKAKENPTIIATQRGEICCVIMLHRPATDQHISYQSFQITL